MSRGDAVGVRKIAAEQHFTEPPPRYSEASLIKKMEELGIGRPSTYTAILTVLRDRGYVRLEKKRLIPEDKGRIVTAFLESFFGRYVEYDFTANLEEQLDRVSAGEIDWRDVLARFLARFHRGIGRDQGPARLRSTRRAEHHSRAAHLPANRRRRRSAHLPVLRQWPTVAQARQVRLLRRLLQLSGVPLHPAMSTPEGGDKEAVPAEGIELGAHPETGEKVTRREGRFGPYLQLGEAESKVRSRSGRRSPRAITRARSTSKPR